RPVPRGSRSVPWPLPSLVFLRYYRRKGRVAPVENSMVVRLLDSELSLCWRNNGLIVSIPLQNTIGSSLGGQHEGHTMSCASDRDIKFGSADGLLNWLAFTHELCNRCGGKNQNMI